MGGWRFGFEQDSGCGIEPEVIDRIFEKFVKVGKGSGEGTGLGLSITKNFVELLNGTIKVSSDPGMGTLFQVALPVRISDKVDVPLPKLSARVTGLRPGQPSRRLLVVEDNWENRLLLTEILENAGLEV
jgi:hypothetical protein